MPEEMEIHGFDFKDKTYITSISKQRAQENIWTKQGLCGQSGYYIKRNFVTYIGHIEEL
jgi:hypothetical protein